MKYYLIFALLFSSFLYSQDIDIEKLKKIDTIYVLFKEGKDQKETNIKNHKQNGYTFLKNIFFQVKTDTNNNIIERIEKKCFLKKHNKDIISIDFFKTGVARLKMDEIIENTKIIYIIDEMIT